MSLNESIDNSTFIFHWFYWKEGHIIPWLDQWLSLTVTDVSESGAFY